MIDLLAAVIAYLETPMAPQIGTQIAARHKFAMGLNAADARMGWTTPSKALTVNYDGGALPDIYAGVERARLDARCYGATFEDAAEVYGALIGVCDAFVRAEVATDNGTALLYNLYPDTTARPDEDADTGAPFFQVFLRASVHKDPV